MTISLQSITTTKRILTPPRILLYAAQGLGKSTIGSEFPNPYVLPTEEGVDNIEVAKAPISNSFDQLMEYILLLRREKHNYQTCVLDTTSGAEKLIQREVCSLNKNVPSVADVPFGKGYAQSTQLFIKLLDALEDLRTNRGMIILLLGHESIERVEPPDSEPYTEYGVQLDKRIAPVVYQWVDAILYGKYKITTKLVDTGFGKKEAQVVSNEAKESPRVIYTEKRPAFVAKNRYGLPFQFQWEKTGTAANIINTIQKVFSESTKKTQVEKAPAAQKPLPGKVVKPPVATPPPADTSTDVGDLARGVSPAVTENQDTGGR